MVSRSAGHPDRIEYVVTTILTVTSLVEYYYCGTQPYSNPRICSNAPTLTNDCAIPSLASSISQKNIPILRTGFRKNFLSCPPSPRSKNRIRSSRTEVSSTLKPSPASGESPRTPCPSLVSGLWSPARTAETRRHKSNFSAAYAYLPLFCRHCILPDADFAPLHDSTLLPFVLSVCFLMIFLLGSVSLVLREGPPRKRMG